MAVRFGSLNMLHSAADQLKTQTGNNKEQLVWLLSKSTNLPPSTSKVHLLTRFVLLI